ncbi:MAG TPA: hypothetical protein VF911_03440 [Thermoanaerobaculia bacterium]
MTTRTILILTLTIAGAISAQETATPGPSSPAEERSASTAAKSTTDEETSTAETARTSTSREAASGDDATAESTEQPVNAAGVRAEFTSLLSQGPPEVATILTLDPTLLSDAAFMGRYPRLAQFVAEHPEVRHHPRYYLSAFEERPIPRDSELEEILEPFVILAVFTLIAVALSWLVRTIIEQKRWNRLSRTQCEVHNKILDRFGTSAEVLDYIRTPAGSKFLESAPIPLHTEPVSRGTAMPRVVWTIQIGVIVAAAALGMLLVSLRFSDETGNGLFALGVIALFIGLGFTGSAAVSIFLSRRLGMFDVPPAGEQANDSGVMK